MVPLLAAVSYYSLLRGVLSPETICSIAHRHGYKALCIADRNNFYGLPLFLAQCKRYGLKPIVGAEITENDENALIYADGEEGYATLCGIISARQMNKSFSIVSMLNKSHEGVTVVTDSPNVFKTIDASVSIFYRMQRPRRIPKWVKEKGIKAVIAPPFAVENENDFRTHRLLRAIENHSTLSRITLKDCMPKDALFVAPEVIEERFELFPEELKTTETFAESIRCGAGNGKVLMPKLKDTSAASTLLEKKVFKGAALRYQKLTEPIKKRIAYELDLIIKKGFADYFLIVEDIVGRSPRTCGRGSGAASIVAYALGITNVDPIRYNLMFERFLNPGRIDPPDIDIDFAWDERDAVLDYVYAAYGKEYTAMVATHQTCGARMAIREVARVYGLTEQEISAVTKKIPWFVDISDYAESLEKLLEEWPALKDAHLDPPWPEILREAGRILGFPRGIGTHCGGVVITPCPIQSVAPVQRSAKGYPIVQWEKEGVEEMGLVKIDLLGNRSLAVIRDTIASLKEEGITIDEQRWDPQSDPETVRLLAEGRTIGVFYVESPAMRLLQRKSGVGDFERLVIHSSIIRPAANRFIREYLRRLKGERWEPLHPLLEGTLSETFGILVYQEDVAKVAIALAGFSVEEADKLRKIMAKKSSATLEEYRTRFFDGAAANGVQNSVIEQVWEMMESFRGYSFCKPHSASYVQVSFQSAWLKAHYPAHFMAAVLSNYGGFYTTQAYVSEAMRLGLTVLPPDVNKSFVTYQASKMTIQVGLCQIKGLSHSSRQLIVKERERNGDYLSIDNLLSRCRIEEADGEVLVFAGACDSLLPDRNRPELFWLMRRFYRTRQGGTIPSLKQITHRYFLQSQYKTLGFLTECHPITLLSSSHKRPVMRGNRIDAMVGKTVSLYGWCVTSKTVSTKYGDSMEFVTFEDETGIFETVFFPDVYKKYSALLAWQMAFVLEGRVTEEWNVAVLEIKKIKRLS